MLPTDGVVAVVKRDCPTCELVAPLLVDLRRAGHVGAVVCQDDRGFPAGIDVVDDSDLDLSWDLGIETVPTLLRLAGGREAARAEGWSRAQWEQLLGVTGIGRGLPDHRPGCGSATLDPGRADALLVRHRGGILTSRRVELGELEDPFEAMFDRGWSDGLPVVPPTEARVLRMLSGTTRDPAEVVAVVPPGLVACTVEKVAVNAVMAGCRPEYLPVVLASVEAACSDAFNAHGVLATTWSAGPLIIVNGPVARAIGMNSTGNALGQGNRANATIGRALQLVIRNVGGGRPGPGGIDRAALGHPGKVGWCFAEDEEGSPWEPLSVSRGVAPGRSAVTLFAGSGATPFIDQLSRTPDSLVRTMAAVLRASAHPKLAPAFDCVLVVSPEHARVYRDAGWDRTRLLAELTDLLQLDAAGLTRGVGGIAEGMPAALTAAGGQLPKFRPGGLLVVHAGGRAGMFSTVIPGWASGRTGSEPVTRPIDGPA